MGASLSWALVRAVIAERAITIVTRLATDGPMIYMLALDSTWQGLIDAFLIFNFVYFVLCIGVVLVSDAVYAMTGHDITGLETLRQLEHAQLERTQWAKRAVQKIIGSPRLIFWVGSWFYLDPDYVTLLIRDKKTGYHWTFLTITLPAVVISNIVWLSVWWCAVQGFKWALWLMEWVF